MTDPLEEAIEQRDRWIKQANQYHQALSNATRPPIAPEVLDAVAIYHDSGGTVAERMDKVLNGFVIKRKGFMETPGTYDRVLEVTQRVCDKAAADVAAQIAARIEQEQP
jgi:hypothetical protein